MPRKKTAAPKPAAAPAQSGPDPLLTQIANLLVMVRDGVTELREASEATAAAIDSLTEKVDALPLNFTEQLSQNVGSQREVVQRLIELLNRGMRHDAWKLDTKIDPPPAPADVSPFQEQIAFLSAQFGNAKGEWPLTSVINRLAENETSAPLFATLSPQERYDCLMAVDNLRVEGEGKHKMLVAGGTS